MTSTTQHFKFEAGESVNVNDYGRWRPAEIVEPREPGIGRHEPVYLVQFTDTPPADHGTPLQERTILPEAQVKRKTLVTGASQVVSAMADTEPQEVERQMFAVVVVVEAEDGAEAWDAVADALKDDGATRYVGAPYESIPAGAEDFTTDAIRLGMTVPVGGEIHNVSGYLTPCD